MPHTRSVSVGIFVGAGSRYETDAIAGASHFLEHVLFKGTERRPEPQLISGAIESVGGIMNAATDREATSYYAKVANDHFPLALDVLTDIIMHPLFKPDEIERERGVIIEELSMTYDMPDAYADLLIDETLWPKQAMGRDIGGTKESVTALTRDQIADYHARQYVPNNVVIAVAGNVAHEQVVSLVAERMADWKGGTPLDWEPVSLHTNGPRVSVGNRKTDQAHICLAVDGVSAMDPERYAVDVMNTVLGEGMTSRLFMEIRERQGLAYEVHSSSMHYRDCGALMVYCGVDTSKADQAIKGVVAELSRLAENVTKEELNRAVEYSVGRLGLRLEDTRAVMGWLGGHELLRGHVEEPDEIISKVRAVTTDEVMASAQKHLRDASYRLAVVGPYKSEAAFAKLLG